ncbi:hypothetical protein SAMN05444149_102405 [Pseudosulfitobacter pseudonitzschiae]|uniref:Uncharacterized protein n=1 Tax=Pseudosulfitobacter pseudonitzschiae TaxID=1402135 RepID=A0A073JEB6_9RHOB|nr:hypothetical protein [Pseudosulfitobacter pseudonitzschiae]KEJ96047.1 hypothetical protein SUH3_17440 [Pseudosulfitobacter pseudonitzschiae]QKS09796.1 hypothetical protein HT745_15545 [Pseudosulfitobacter pseudonitzschiae]SHE95360.1 hypothetical protein SAMN05444149_102405 [Pseudosulfitobacter pseudonitzschiae]
MPTKSLILPEYRLIWQRYWGSLLRHEIFAARDLVQNAPDYDPSFDVLQDFRGTEENELTHSEVILLAESLKAQRQDIGIPLRLALLAPDDLGFGMGRMFMTLVGDDPLILTATFRTLDEVVDFLALSPEAHVLIRDMATDNIPGTTDRRQTPPRSG